MQSIKIYKNKKTLKIYQVNQDYVIEKKNFLILHFEIHEEYIIAFVCLFVSLFFNMRFRKIKNKNKIIK